MTIIELFTEVFKDNVFDPPRTQERTDKRCAVYRYMKEMGMTHEDIATEVGRNQSTIGIGARKFTELFEAGDPSAIKAWQSLNEGIRRFLATTENGILTINHARGTIPITSIQSK